MFSQIKTESKPGSASTMPNFDPYKEYMTSFTILLQKIVSENVFCFVHFNWHKLQIIILKQNRLDNGLRMWLMKTTLKLNTHFKHFQSSWTYKTPPLLYQPESESQTASGISCLGATVIKCCVLVFCATKRNGNKNQNNTDHMNHDYSTIYDVVIRLKAHIFWTNILKVFNKIINTKMNKQHNFL